MSIQVVDRLAGSAGGSVTITLPSYQAGDVVYIAGADGEGPLFFSQTVSQQGWNLFRHNRFTTASIFVLWKYMDGSEGSSLMLTGTFPTSAPPKDYMKVSVRGADKYRGFAMLDSVSGETFSGDWPIMATCDPPALAHPFLPGEELLWAALGVSDANPDPLGTFADGPTGVDFSYVNYYEPTNISPTQPRASNLGYADRISDDSSWDPEAWTHPTSEEECAWTLAFPPERTHTHPDLVKTERLKTGSMSSPQTVSVTVPATDSGLLVFYVCGGNGVTLELDPSGLNIAPELGASIVDSTGSVATAQMFFCDAPPAGTYDLRLTKVGASNDRRTIIVYTMENADEVVDWATANATASPNDLTLNLATESDCLCVVGTSTSVNSGENAFPGEHLRAFIDSVPLASQMDHMTLSAEVAAVGTQVACRAWVGRTGGGTQEFRMRYVSGSAQKRMLVMYVRGRSGDNPIWASTDF